MSISSFHLALVQDVIGSTRSDFLEEGLDESLLRNLQSVWELKMMQAASTQSTVQIQRAGATPFTPFHDLNVPYKTLEVEMLSPGTPLPEPLLLNNYLPLGSQAGAALDARMESPSPCMERPALWMTQRPSGVGNSQKRVHSQVDGIDDSYDSGVVEEDYNEFDGEEAQAGSAGTDADASEAEGLEPPLNEDDDDDDGLDGLGDGSNTDDGVLTLFEKVKKVKGKWKCIFRHGVMRLNNQDFVFKKAIGVFYF